MSDIQAKRSDILRITAEHGGRMPRLFGSVLRGEATPNSDIDLLVEMEKHRSLLDLIAIKLDLEELLGQKVDVVTPNALHHLIRDEVLKEAVAI